MAASAKHRFKSDINVVPYIDVMLVLLVIFMVTAPLITQGIQVNLPSANSKPMDVKKQEPLIVSLKQDGSLYLNIGGNQDQAKSLPSIQQAVSKIIQAKPDTAVLIWADHRIDYGQVVALMDKLEQAGVAQVGLVTEPLQ